jgi:hypothetical protein
MTFRGRAVLLKKPSKLEIKRYNNTIFFTDLGNLELKLNPKERAVFLFFLNQSTEGIKLKDLKQKREDLFKYYSLNSIYSKEFRDKVIDELVDSKKNEINVVISRINKKIKDAIGESLSEFYCIKGERGEKKRIKIDRELISGLN